jgi:superfamily I DNA and/or RNA helicase
VSKVLHPDVIIVDDAGMMHESLLWPVLAVYDPNVFLLLGDDRQLRPHSTSSRESNPFRPQYQTSLLSRLAASGSLAGTLAVQHRMTTDIAWLLNSVFYCGRLWTYPTTHHFVRDGAKKIRDFNRRQGSFMIKANVVFIDIDGNETMEGKSWRNPTNAAEGIKLCKNLLVSSTVNADQIVILSPYSSQQTLYRGLLDIEQRASAHLAESRRLPSLDLNIGKIRVETVDSFQGQESDVIIFDVVRNNDWGFVADQYRLCTALSRGLSGLYVLFNWEGSLDKRLRRYRPYVKHMVDIVCQNRWIYSKRKFKMQRKQENLLHHS